MYKWRDEAGNVEGKKKEGHETDQECALCSHTIIITTNYTRVLFEADFFFLFFILFLTYLLTLSSHIVYFCVFFQNITIIFDLFDELIFRFFFKLMLLYYNLSSYIIYDYYWIFSFGFFFIQYYSQIYKGIYLNI